jgi:hypothetical protein
MVSGQFADQLEWITTGNKLEVCHERAPTMLVEISRLRI